jgi:signal peptidase I
LTPEIKPLPPEVQPSLADKARAFLGAILSWVILPLLVVFVIHTFIFQPYRVSGTSMFPYLEDSNYLVISKVEQTFVSLQHLLGNKSVGYLPKRGQIIVLRYPKDPTQTFVKRVVGLPGDRVVIKDGEVNVYNFAHPEGFNPDIPYEPVYTKTDVDTDVTVNPNEVFVLGDNRLPGKSSDSRYWGQLPSSDIIGPAVLRLWPVDQFKVLPL